MAVKLNKLFDSNWDNVYNGEERTKNSEISVLPLVSEVYEDSTTQDMDTLLSRRMIEQEMYEIFEKSPYYEKYADGQTKIDKKEISDIYYYFRDEMNRLHNHNKVEVLCAICEFFDLNYSNMYNNVLSLEEKSNILEILENDYGLQSRFKHSKKLF